MTISFKVSDKTKEEMIKHFEYLKRDKTPQYAIFQADEEDTVVTLYESGKVVFQGVSADVDANFWKETEKILTGSYPEEKEKKKKEEPEDKTDYYFINSIGSDEVGTGDFFGPIIVTASYVSRNDISFLEELGVRDSKKVTDEKIMKIAPVIIDKIPHETFILTNEEYNEWQNKGYNMNKIKSILHNRVNLDNVTITASNNALSNSGTATIDNVVITAGGTGFSNSGTYTITNSNIQGNSYAVYDNSTSTNSIEDSTLRSGSNSLYKNSSSSITVLDTDLIGNVTNNNANGLLDITNKSITGYVTNKGQTSIKNSTISIASSSSGETNFINNSGVLTLNNNNVTYTNVYGNWNYNHRIVYNSGTLNSSNNNYSITYNYGGRRQNNLHGIDNRGILSSTNDSIEGSMGYYIYGIYNSSSNSATINNVDISIHDYNTSSGYAYGIMDASGTMTVNGGTIEVYNGYEGKGLYADGSGANLTVNDLIVNVHDNSNYSAGTYQNNGSLTIESGTFTISSPGTAIGLRLVGGTQTIETGNVSVSGGTTYGINMSVGTFISGIYDGRGTESADVSITDPHIEANGTTSGTGISMGNGTFNFYDGIISGTTSARASGNIVSNVELNYAVTTASDGKSMWLEFIR